jgi:hypothetical protein
MRVSSSQCYIVGSLLYVLALLQVIVFLTIPNVQGIDYIINDPGLIWKAEHDKKQLSTLLHFLQQRHPIHNINFYRSTESSTLNSTIYHERKPEFPPSYLGSSTLNSSSYKPLGGMRFYEYANGDSPYSISPFINYASDEIARERRVHVKAAMKHAWSSYESLALGSDELLPVSGGNTSPWGGMGTTLIDALDTLWLMDMKEEFYTGMHWVETYLDFNIDRNVSVFESTIRCLGGLLSAYEVSGEQCFLKKAVDLGDRLLWSMNSTKLGIPYGQINLANGVQSFPEWLAAYNVSILADVGSIQLEFRKLSELTNNDEYKIRAEWIINQLSKLNPTDGLYPYFIYPSEEKGIQFAVADTSFGPYGDSFYEYLLKVWIQGGKKESMYREMYDSAIDGLHKRFLNKAMNGLWYIHTGHRKRVDHLTCFMGGLLALGAMTDPRGPTSIKAQRDMKSAKALTYTCYQMYAQMPTGLSADRVMLGNLIFVTEPRYILRPETVESLYILNKVTGDPIFREWGWEIFQSIEKYCKTKLAYGRYSNVQNVGLRPDDSMESFFLAETLKYLYLMNDPESDLDFKTHVFNTEGHPFRITL